MNYISKLIYYLNHTGRKIPRTPKVNIGFYHLTFNLGGSFSYIADGVQYDLEENDALLLVPGTTRERLAIPNDVKYVIINFIADHDFIIKSNTFFKNGFTPSISKLIDAFPCMLFSPGNNFEVNSYDTAKTRAILKNLSNCIIINLLDSLNNETKNQHAVKAVTFIQNNLHLPITLEDVCREIHLSKSYTTRLLKKELGMTVSEYINRQKLSLAVNLLANEDMSLQSISSALGYENYCYFSKIFKAHYGVSPIKMRNKLKSQ